MKKYLFNTLLAAFALLSNSPEAFTQESDTVRRFSFSGYAELYYLYDSGEPDTHDRPGFIYSHNRHNEVTLNLGYFKGTYHAPNVRANLAMMAGTYANANLAAEPGVLKNIFEANIGVRLSKIKETWLDAGIFPSHLGVESAAGRDCWTLTRSIMADNSPYFESGVKISHASPNGRWLLSGLLLNGWQRIQRREGNQTPALGTQITFFPNDKITLNSSAFIGNDQPDSTRQWRYFHNLYGIFQLNGKWAATLAIDVGAEQESKGSSNYRVWYATALLLKYQFADRWSATSRLEYYADEKGVIVTTGTPNGFQTFGWSVNADFTVLDNLVWRIEGRGFRSRDDIFSKNGQPLPGNFSIATALALAF